LLLPSIPYRTTLLGPCPGSSGPLRVRMHGRGFEGLANSVKSNSPLTDTASPATVGRSRRRAGVQWGGLERELMRGPLAHSFQGERQGCTLSRIKLVIGCLLHVGYTVEGVWKLMRRHGRSAQLSVGTGRGGQRGVEGGGVTAGRATADDRAPASASRTKRARG